MFSKLMAPLVDFRTTPRAIAGVEACLRISGELHLCNGKGREGTCEGIRKSFEGELPETYGNRHRTNHNRSRSPIRSGRVTILTRTWGASQVFSRTCVRIHRQAQWSKPIENILTDSGYCQLAC